MSSKVITKNSSPRAGIYIEEIQREKGTSYRVRVRDTTANRLISVKNPQTGGNTFYSFESCFGAAEKEQQRILGAYHDAGIETQAPRRRRFAEYARTWLAGPGRYTKKGVLATKGTMLTRKGIVGALVKEFGDQWVDEITKTDYQAADTRWLDAGYARKTREARLTTFRAIIRHAQDDHLRYDDPTKGITVYAEREREPRLLTDQEMLLLLYFMPKWFWPAALLAHDCGLRAAEVCGLRWFRLSLDGDDPSVLVKDVMEPDRTLRGYPKGKKAARVALTPRVVTALRVLRASRPADGDGDFVFRNSRDLPLPPNEPNRLLAAAFTRSGLTGQRPVFHDLRHSCGDNLARHNASAVVITNVLRHGNLKTSQGYIGAVSTREQRDWMMRVQSGVAIAPVIPLSDVISATNDEKYFRVS